MGNILSKIIDFVGFEHVRTKQIVKHIGWAFIFKIGTIISNFLLVPLTINYLDTENYGVWLTLSSFIMWFSIFDIGLGHGLRNKFAEAKAKENYQDAQALVSTAYYTIACISICMMVIFFVVNNYIKWSTVFNTSVELDKTLDILLPVVFVFFAIQLIVKLITTIYQANQNHSIDNKIQFFTQILSLFAIWILTKSNESSLLIFGSIFSAIPVIILIVLNTYAFNSEFKNFKPRFRLASKKYLKDITGIGFNFFIVQIAALVLFSTDNFIITNLFSPEEVVPYNIAYKYFSILLMVFAIVTTPYWSSFTDAFARKDTNWIENSVKTLMKIWLFVPIGLGLMLFLSDWFYELWVGDKIIIPLQLSLAMALFVAIMTFNMIYVNFINGVGKIRLQLYTSVLTMFLNIPLSMFFGRYLEWGTTGVILATCFCLGYTLPLWPMQYKKIINGTAVGVWNK
ncbi:lipopolysaccharide biosynthesis protein [Cellulophaga tyrosinoxydans]|uniref:Membrane protein involved in the export of O-antigen and teichoic acid n=1 Tax=Cellulophaga tyrosinoxydans TaxID=504486 RepID=A0A1W2AQH1_9FLAO|nr:oligosaccharide flippase family protein [Cellulophaga tyrosinoxydans]SMC62913.1 Membrane protein involved in the export of O-antigen and teichoic acid [Cellulophaga tyrosinoxydans]